MNEHDGVARARAAKAKRRKKRLMRKIARMVIWALIVLIAVFLVVLIIKGITKPKYDKAKTTTLIVNEDGSLTLEEMGWLDNQLKKTKEMKAELDEEIKTFNETHRGKITLDAFENDKNELYLRTTYSNAEAYSAYSGYECFVGTVDEAIAAGYDFATEFMIVTGNVKASDADSSFITATGSANVFIIKENITVVIPGVINYISDPSTQIEAKDKVLISQSDGNQDAADLVYIIY